jgi:hypothetical protein
MVLVLVLGGVLGWFVYRARVQREAIAAIERAGGKTYYGWQVQYSRLGDLTFYPAGRPPGPRWLVDWLGLDYFCTVRYADISGPADDLMPHIGRLVGLEELDFHASRTDRTNLGPTDAGMVHLRGLTRLRKLTLGVNTSGGPLGSKITGASLAAISGCTRLLFLELNGITVADADLAALRGLTKLTNLDLHGPGVTTAGLVHLKGMNRLTGLNLSQTNVDSLEPLRTLASLNTLALAGTPIGDAGLAPASPDAPGFAGLTVLNLFKTRVSDAGLTHLRNLPKLRSLTLVGTKVTEAGVAELVKERPAIRPMLVSPPQTPRPARKARPPATKAAPPG